MPEKGSFHWYVNSDDKFFVNLTIAVMHADSNNIKKLTKIFKHLCVSHKEPNLDMAPKTNYSLNENEEVELPKNGLGKENSKPGTFSRYLKMSGDFVTHLAKAIIYADEFNLNLISKEYPQMVAAYNEQCWEICPKGFEYPLYNSMPKK